MTLYRNIIKGSLRESLKHKYLWFFGLFAVLLGNGGEYEILVRSFAKPEADSEIERSFVGMFFSQFIENYNNLIDIINNFFARPAFAMIVLGVYLFIMAVMLFVVWMMNVSQVAIVDATYKREKDKDHDIKIGLEKGMRNFWPVFALNTLIKILSVVGVYLLAITMYNPLSILVFVITVPLLMSISFIVKYAIAYMVIRKEGLDQSLKSAWKLFSKNWLISLELGLLLYLYTFLAGLIFMFATFNVMKFYEVLSFAFPNQSFYIFTVLMPLSLFLVLAFIGSVLAVFQITVWTKLFLRLEQEGGKSKIERVFNRD